MKNIIVILCFFIAGFNAANAQQAPAKTTAKTTATTTKATEKKAVKKSTGTKKDGTPDMRMKQNKDSVKTKRPAGPTKKDGSADMRYKANKK